MFSNNVLFKLTSHSFYILFYHYLFIELQLNQYKLLLFLQLFLHQLLFFGVLVIIFASLVFDLIVCIDWISVHWSWTLSSDVIENFMWTYPKRKYGFASPSGLWKVLLRVLVGYFIPFCFNLLILLI